MICPRCGRGQPPESRSGVFCVHCGQFLVATQWVAMPPPAPRPPGDSNTSQSDPHRWERSQQTSAHRSPPGSDARTRWRGRYTGPPSYQTPPRWGFPPIPWHRERPEPPPSPAVLAGRQAGLLIPLLRGVAVLAALAAAAEVWRYVLLLRSRASALDASEVAASDALEQAASWVCTLMAVGVGCLMLVWLRRVIEAAARNAKVRPSRGGVATVLGWLLPGLNLSVPGSVLAEVEHAALGRPARARPHPSRLLLVWWALWATNVVLGVVAVIWMFRSGVQAKADGVVLHALVDAAAAATAVVTARVVAWLTALVNPPRSIPLPRVVSVAPRVAPAERASAPRVAPAERASAPREAPAERASAHPAQAG